jgi:hypothetical protein
MDSPSSIFLIMIFPPNGNQISTPAPARYSRAIA